MQISVDDEIDRVRREWAEELPQLDTSPLEVIGRILRAEHLAGAELRRGLRRAGLDRGSFDALATLRRTGPPYRLTPTGLAERLVLTSGAITHLVDELARASLVRRVPGDRDRRSTQVELTERGREVIEETMASYLEQEARMTAHLSPGERSALAEGLRRLLQGMEEDGDEPG
ncbi:MAG TPA: MarR family transcriptional regulator [Candidatus Dormibacteraeota bacterium]|nr:MarR family transcriptional regulator [Candidatus Dormibacteraeota bacterium]